MSYHVRINQERRTGDRKTPFVVTPSIPTGRTITVAGMEVPEMAAGDTQLHCLSEAIGPKFQTDDNIVYVAEWDGKAPYVTVLKGDHAARLLDFAGWPAITEKDYVPPPADL